MRHLQASTNRPIHTYVHSARTNAAAIITWAGRPHGRHSRLGDVTGTQRLELPHGQKALFTINQRSEVRLAGEVDAVAQIEAEQHCWSLSNFTFATTFVVENLEGGVELIKVGPRRLSVFVPFEMSRILIPSTNGAVELKVFGMPPTYLAAEIPEEGPADTGGGLDEQSKYFRILVALCEPRLRLSPMAAVPSVREIVERLRPLPGFEQTNRSSVNYHIEYLRESKLPVDEWASAAYSGRMHSKREALASYALRYDLVREEHLSLLPPWRQSHAA